MPSRTRGTCSAKASKENICVVKTSKSKGSVKAAKSARKPLTDKTNSASDDNASVVSSKKNQKAVPCKEATDYDNKNLKRPRRTKRVPTRYKENIILNNLSVTHNVSLNSESPINFAPLQNKLPVLSTLMETCKTVASKKPEKKNSPVHKSSPMLKVPLNGPTQEQDYNLAINRPRRICRLPSKFDDHSISPNKFIPVQPINASTPLAKKNTSNYNRNSQKNINSKNGEQHITPINVSNNTVLLQKLVRNNTKQGITSDTNNNAKQNKQQISPLKSPIKNLVTRPRAQKLLAKNDSPKLLDGNKKQLKRDSSKLDVYEFIYDPDEEPQPAKKKKRKQTARKLKPKTVTIKSNYDKNLAKALAALKNTAASKSSNIEIVKKNEPAGITKNNDDNKNDNFANSKHDTDLVKNVSTVHEKNYNSVRLEDIAKDILSNDDGHAIDYSPINSPSHPDIQTDPTNESVPKPNNADPLNLQDDLSFFDDIPVASSSMNVSVRHPLASPWRVEFGNLPIKWQSNTYVKPNMTPAVESSFINFNDSKKRHVYTNMVLENNDSLPKVIDDPPNLIQTSIISFIKEVAEKQANKKNKKNMTPVKGNSLFEETTAILNNKTPNKQTSLHKNICVTPDTERKSDEVQSDASAEAKNNGNAKTPNPLHKSSDKYNTTCFGFDDIEDQENISPSKKNNKVKSLRSRTRGILQEINGHKGPTRANIPLAESKALKTKNKLLDQIKSVTNPQTFPEIAVTGNTDISKTGEPCLAEHLENEDSQSVHLFEDMEFLHNHKESCRSYTKNKKVTFHNKSVENSDDSSVSDIDGNRVSGDEDNLDDISFRLPSERPKRTKKKKPKKLLSKKEEKEVEAWAANFNSMCEDVDEFDLVVE